MGNDTWTHATSAILFLTCVSITTADITSYKQTSLEGKILLSYVCQQKIIFVELSKISANISRNSVRDWFQNVC